MEFANTLKSFGARVTMGEDDVRSLLEKDHDEVKEILVGLVDGKRGQSRAALLEKLKINLTAHSRAEEKVVYDALIKARAQKDVRALAEEGYVEHGVVDDLLKRLSRLDPATDLWKAHAKVVRELLEHHIEEEQNETFAELGEHFSREELIAMGEQFLRHKLRVLTKGAPQPISAIKRVDAVVRQRKFAEAGHSNAAK